VSAPPPSSTTLGRCDAYCVSMVVAGSQSPAVGDEALAAAVQARPAPSAVRPHARERHIVFRRDTRRENHIGRRQSTSTTVGSTYDRS
jgi:hypothetical protein